MGGTRGSRRDDPYADETVRQVAARAPAGFAFFIACVTLSTGFEIARFPERRDWMLGFAGVSALLAAASQLLLQRHRTWSTVILLVFLNVVGMGLNAYHAIVGASVAMCLWTLTGLLCSSAMILRWGGTNQAIASIGNP